MVLAIYPAVRKDLAWYLGNFTLSTALLVLSASVYSPPHLPLQPHQPYPPRPLACMSGASSQ